MRVAELTWTEKYRPETLEDVIGNEEVVDRLKRLSDNAAMPNLLFTGPSGTGKTSAAVALAKEIFGDDYEANFIEMNASDERGIGVVRDQIKGIAQEATAEGSPFKIIFLDECDNLTKDAQASLRRVMEQYSDQTRFILSCNYHNRLIDPLQSRCSICSFTALEDDEIREIMTRVAEGEDLEWEEEAFDMIVDNAHGDARRAIYSLQETAVEEEVLVDEVENVVFHVSEEDIGQMIHYAVNGRMERAMDKNIRDIQPEVTDYSQFCKEIMSVLRQSEEIHSDVRFYAMSQLGELERNILEGASPEVQVNSFLAMLPTIQYSSIPNYSEEE